MGSERVRACFGLPPRQDEAAAPAYTGHGALVLSDFQPQPLERRLSC